MLKVQASAGVFPAVRIYVSKFAAVILEEAAFLCIDLDGVESIRILFAKK